MYKNKKTLILSSTLFMLSVFIVAGNVLAQNYVDPSNPPPGGNVGLNFLENPLTEDLDLDNNKILNASEIHTNQLFISGSLDIAGQPSSANESRWAFGATAGKVNSPINSFTFGFYGKTLSNSGSNPSYALYGESNNAGGRAVYGKANNGYALYGESNNNPAVFGLSTGMTSAGVFGLGANGVVGQSNQVGGAGIYGHAGIGAYAGYFDGLLYLANGGQLYVETSGNLSPIVGVADYDNNNAGVQGYGNIGIYGGGDVVGVYGYGEYGVLAKGARTISIVPPPGGEWEGEEPPEDSNIISLLGLSKASAAVGNYTAYTMGLIAIGGSNGGGTLTHAGLGLCALSGAEDFALGANPNYYTYCQDINGKNNYAGFFAGDVYFKDSSLQIRGALAANNENMIYANASSAVAGSHLLKLQTNSADRFRVDKDGNAYLAGNLALQNIDSSGNLLLTGASSFIDFRGGSSGPACKSGDEGIIYYFSNYKALCLCQGSNGWINLVPGGEDGQCTNGSWFPS